MDAHKRNTKTHAEAGFTAHGMECPQAQKKKVQKTKPKRGEERGVGTEGDAIKATRKPRRQ